MRGVVIGTREGSGSRPELAVEIFYEGVPNRFAELDEPQSHAGSRGPIGHGFAGTFGSVA